jgi:hypothetical protein
MFRSEIKGLLQFISGLSRAKRVSAKIAGTELSWDLQELVDKRVEQIAKEADPEKRLMLARQPFLLSKEMQELSNDELNALRQFHLRQRTAFWIDLYKGELVSFNRLASLGLVHSSNLNSPSMYDDFFGEFTTLGLKVVEAAFPKDN